MWFIRRWSIINENAVLNLPYIIWRFANPPKISKACCFPENVLNLSTYSISFKPHPRFAICTSFSISLEFELLILFRLQYNIFSQYFNFHSRYLYIQTHHFQRISLFSENSSLSISENSAYIIYIFQELILSCLFRHFPE